METVTSVPIVPVSVAPIVESQTPKPIEQVRVEPKSTKITDVLPPKVKPVVKPLPDVQPRRPTVLKQQVVKPPSRRTTQQVPTTPPPRVRPVQPVSPPMPPKVALALPRQPTSIRKQAPPSQSQSSDAEPDALNAYLQLIFQTLEKHKRYPKYAKRQSMNGHVVLQFVILPDGRAINSQIAKSDGHKSFRREALRALSRVGQMPPFPSGIRRKQLSVEVPIAYQIKKR